MVTANDWLTKIFNMLFDIVEDELSKRKKRRELEEPHESYREDNSKFMNHILDTDFVDKIKSGEHPHGVLLTTGKTLLVKAINSISVDNNKEIWINFSMCQEGDAIQLINEISIEEFYQQTSCIFTRSGFKKNIEIKASSIVGVFELKVEEK